MSANRLKRNAEKTELMCAGIRYSVANLLCDDDFSLTLGADIVKATDVIRVLGVLFTPDLALEKQVTSVSAKCFFQLRQLRRVRRSLERDSAATLVHAFVTSRIDYDNALLANAPKIWTEKLQQVLNAAARVTFSTMTFTVWMFPNVSSSNCA